MQAITSLLAGLNALSPLAVIGLLGLVLLFQARNRATLTEVTDNHLHAMPDIVLALQRIEQTLKDINDNVVYVRARINGSK